MKIWGYWATLGWAVLAFLAGQFAGSAVLLWQSAGAWSSLLATPYDGVMVTLFVVISNPVTIGAIMLAVLGFNMIADGLRDWLDPHQAAGR